MGCLNIVGPQALHDRLGGLRRGPRRNVDVAVDARQAGYWRLVEAQKHHGCVAALLDNVSDRPPFEAAPFFAVVVTTQNTTTRALAHRTESLGIHKSAF